MIVFDIKKILVKGPKKAKIEYCHDSIVTTKGSFITKKRRLDDCLLLFVVEMQFFWMQ